MNRWMCIVCVVFLSAVLSADEKTAITVDKEKRTITLDAKIAPRKLEHLKGEIYPIEVIACWAHPKGEKAHETVVTNPDVLPKEGTEVKLVIELPAK